MFFATKIILNTESVRGKHICTHIPIFIFDWNICGNIKVRLHEHVRHTCVCICEFECVYVLILSEYMRVVCVM